MSTSIVRQLSEQHGRVRHATVVSGCRADRPGHRRGPALRRRCRRHVGSAAGPSRSTAAMVPTTAGVTACFRRVLATTKQTSNLIQCYGLVPNHISMITTHLERPARGDDVSSVVDVIPSASQDMALQPISSSDLSTDCQTALLL